MQTCGGVAYSSLRWGGNVYQRKRVSSTVFTNLKKKGGGDIVFFFFFFVPDHKEWRIVPTSLPSCISQMLVEDKIPWVENMSTNFMLGPSLWLTWNTGKWDDGRGHMVGIESIYTSQGKSRIGKPQSYKEASSQHDQPLPWKRHYLHYPGQETRIHPSSKTDTVFYLKWLSLYKESAEIICKQSCQRFIMKCSEIQEAYRELSAN